MKVDNRWDGGKVNLAFPPLPASEFGTYGALFLQADFKVGAGLEFYLCIMEEPEWANRYGTVDELTVNVTPLAINTDAGPVGILMWHLARGRETLVDYEHYLDPTHPPTRKLLEDVEAQTRLKVVMRDNRSGETTGFWEFDNTFATAIREFVEGCGRAFDGSPCGTLDARIALVQRDYTSKELLAMIAKH